MVYVVMTYVVMAFIVMAYIVMAAGRELGLAAIVDSRLAVRIDMCVDMCKACV